MVRGRLRSVFFNGARIGSRGALVDSVVRDVRFTWRSLRRVPLAALTIVATVGLGLGLGLVAGGFTILNTLVFRADGVRHPHVLFAAIEVR